MLDKHDPCPQSPVDTLAAWRHRPKVLLHEHLDGGLRPATLLDLCRARRLQPPAETAEALGDWFAANAHAGSLERYLAGFALTVGAMASVAACERVAFEAAEDALADGCVLAEFRMAPSLFAPLGLRPEAAIEALLAGLSRSALPCGLIVCAMRMDDPARTASVARMAGRYADRGVIGFDLAGAERGFPPTLHREALHVAHDAGLGLTCHAGEADDGHRVIEAIRLGATRIGHGVRVMDNPVWVEQARASGVHFEVCPSSNVHTGAAASLAAHPFGAMTAAGLNLSCSTDNRLISRVTLSGELAALQVHQGLTVDTLMQQQRAAVRASFLGDACKAAALARIDAA
ncbi:adenosine deaminase [Sphaerotilus sp.]|uniref:adenosine deaminase n=1 Tax=Sphaerotilus sp. TaxID=2093942 RepID=UPI0025FBB348|nr:adenosine deaminase [Sphaerotilus sp.]